jgi:hypothetical protein
MNKLRSTRLLIHKKSKHERRVLTEEKLDDIGTRFQRTPRKSLKRLAEVTEWSVKFWCRTGNTIAEA